MKTIFETNRSILYIQKSESTHNGNGHKTWSLNFRKILGDGDNGDRSSEINCCSKE